MNVYFVNSGLQGCFFVRCLLPMQENGWDGDQTSVHPYRKTPEDKAIAAQSSEVVVFHRPDTEEKLELMKLLKKDGKKIVFDNDDTYKGDGGVKFNEYLDEKRLERGLKRVNSIVDEAIKEADLVTCSTEFLKNEYLKLNPNVKVIPNCVDPFYFDEPLKNETEIVRLGIVGSPLITQDFDVLKPIIEHFVDNPKYKIVIFSLPPERQDKTTRELYSDEYKFIDQHMDKIEWQPFVNMEHYFEVLNNLRLDIMVIPRADNYFNRCKSNLKFLESSMLKIPVIAQGFSDGTSPYQVDEEDANHMIIVTDNSTWCTEIEKLGKDKSKRIDMGDKAYEYVKEKYSIQNNAHKWVEAYKSINK